MTKRIELELDSKNLWQFAGRKIYHKPKKLIDRLSQIKLKPTLEIKSLGEKQPLFTNETMRGRQKNRRVELIFKY